MRQRPGAQLEEDLAPTGSKAEAKRFSQLAVTAVLVDELAQERPSLLRRTG
jgi:hypothetical protein